MSLPSYYLSQKRKDLVERAIVAQREKEESHYRKCKEVASYHRDIAFKSTKYKNLEEGQILKTPRAHEESRVIENRKAAKREKIELRRQKLAHLLAVENNQYMKELQELKEKERYKDPWNICKLKEQIEDLQRKRREAEQNIKKRYMHHVCLSETSISGANEDTQLQKEITEAWRQRKEELEKLNLEKQQKEEEVYKKLESERLRASQEAREVEILQLQEQQKWSSVMQSKADEFDTAKNDSLKLKREKQILVEHLENLLCLQRKRETIREVNKKAFQKIPSMWQAKEKLRRMLNEVKHGLDFDYKLLLTLCDLNNSVVEETALALIDLSSVMSDKEKIEMQIALERERELEIQQLYHEEAVEAWEKRKEEWILESIARDEIMTKLFESLVDQVQKKIEFVTEGEKKLIIVKENCLKEIKDVNEKAKDTAKGLIEKYDYYTDRSSRLSEEIKSHNSDAFSKTLNSAQYNSNLCS